MDSDQLHAFIVNAVQQGTQALSAQVENLNNQVQALQQMSSGHQAPTSQDDEPSHQSMESHSDDDGEGDHDEPSVATRKPRVGRRAPKRLRDCMTVSGRTTHGGEPVPSQEGTRA
jgi:hypothetical protein